MMDIDEIKAVSHLLKTHQAQLLNYLKATGIKVGLLVNFARNKADGNGFARRARGLTSGHVGRILSASVCG